MNCTGEWGTVKGFREKRKMKNKLIAQRCWRGEMEEQGEISGTCEEKVKE